MTRYCLMVASLSLLLAMSSCGGDGGNGEDEDLSGPAVWVTTRIVDGDGTVERIDPATGEVTQSIAAGPVPTRVAVAAGSVWFGEGESGTVWRADPETGDVTSEIDPGGDSELHSAEAVAAIGDEVWVLNAEPSEVVRIDSATDEIAETIELPPEFDEGVFAAPTDMIAGGDSLWIAGGKNIIAQVDPATGESEVAELDGSAFEMYYSEAGLWALVQEDEAQLLDPATLEVEEKIQGDEFEPLGALAVDDAQMLWLGFGPDPSVVPVPPGATDVPAEGIELGTEGDFGPQAMTFGEGRVWAALPGYVVAIDPETEEVAETIEVPGAAAIAFG